MSAALRTRAELVAELQSLRVHGSPEAGAMEGRPPASKAETEALTMHHAAAREQSRIEARRLAAVARSSRRANGIEWDLRASSDPLLGEFIIALHNLHQDVRNGRITAPEEPKTLLGRIHEETANLEALQLSADDPRPFLARLLESMPWDPGELRRLRSAYAAGQPGSPE